MAERIAGNTPKRELATRTPWLIQRCQLDEANLKLIYEYMGSSEFEFGDQAESLKRIFKLGMESFKASIKIENEVSLPFYLVAGKDFNVRQYSTVIRNLAEHKFRTKELTDLKETVKSLLHPDQESGKLFETNAWFDFKNDVLFTPYPQIAEKIIPVLTAIKTKWETPERKSSRKK